MEEETEEETEEEEEGPPKPKNQTDEFSLCDTENRFDVVVVRLSVLPSFLAALALPPSLTRLGLNLRRLSCGEIWS